MSVTFYKKLRAFSKFNDEKYATIWINHCKALKSEMYAKESTDKGKWKTDGNTEACRETISIEQFDTFKLYDKKY